MINCPLKFLSLNVILLVLTGSTEVQPAVRRVTPRCSTRHLCFTVRWCDRPEKTLEPCLASRLEEIVFPLLTSEQTPGVSLCGFHDKIYWWWIKKFWALTDFIRVGFHSDVMFRLNSCLIFILWKLHYQMGFLSSHMYKFILLCWSDQILLWADIIADESIKCMCQQMQIWRHLMYYDNWWLIFFFFYPKYHFVSPINC